MIDMGTILRAELDEQGIGYKVENGKTEDGRSERATTWTREDGTTFTVVERGLEPTEEEMERWFEVFKRRAAKEVDA